jgi:hypothetical protein
MGVLVAPAVRQKLVTQQAQFTQAAQVLIASGGPTLGAEFDEPGNYTVQFSVNQQSTIYPNTLIVVSNASAFTAYTVTTFAGLAGLLPKPVNTLALVSGINTFYILGSDLVTWSVVSVGAIAQIVNSQTYYWLPPGGTPLAWAQIPIGGSINPVATVTWSLGGNRLTRLVSVYDGASISGIAEAVDVRVADQTYPSPGDFQQQYFVTVLAAKGLRASTFQPPTYTTYTIDSTTGLTLLGSMQVSTTDIHKIVAIPQNAGIISVNITAHPLSGTLNEGEVWVSQERYDGQALSTYDPRGAGWMPINPGATQIEFHNAGTETISFGFIFGIDG